MATQIPSYPLRITPLILEKVKAIAQKNMRSTNKQIEYILKNFVDDYEENYGEIDIESASSSKKVVVQNTQNGNNIYSNNGNNIIMT